MVYFTVTLEESWVFQQKPFAGIGGRAIISSSFPNRWKGKMAYPEASAHKQQEHVPGFFSG
jgi:hypothetical protein